MITMTHAELVTLAAKWMRSRRYPIVLEDVRTLATTEQPDVIGWKIGGRERGRSCLVECKASLEDYRRDAQKPFRRVSERGMGILRWYATTTSYANVVAEDIVHRGPEVGRWGVVAFDARKRPTIILNAQPFAMHNVSEENCLLLTAIRRVTEGWGRRMFGPDAPLGPHGDAHPSAAKIIRDLQDENRSLRRKLDRRAYQRDEDVHPFDPLAHDIDA